MNLITMQHETCISMRVHYGIMTYFKFTDSIYLESCPIFNSLIHVCLFGVIRSDKIV